MTNSDKISLQDFAAVINIIDVCSQRGAFKGEELFLVGQVREKFSRFVKENTPDGTTEATNTEAETGE
jgi:hypothetical protein